MTIKIYEVGGSVRDSLLGRRTSDLDYAVEAPSYEAMRAHILECGGKIFVETPEFFTIRAHMPRLGASDFVLCRKDGAYSDGRRPDDVQVGTIKDDLARRDFTVNAIARDMDTGEFIDPFDGREHLRRRFLVAVGSATARMQEDDLRAYRALRFSVTHSLSISFKLESALRAVFEGDVLNAAAQRIQAEVLKMMKADMPVACRVLFSEFPAAGDWLARKGVWLKPTMEAK